MNYRYSRQEIESAIELLADSYPSCFFLDPDKRRPLKHNITVDLSKDAVALSPELLQAAVSWYESNFGYQLALQAGVKRIDPKGRETGTVTEVEHRKAEQYIRTRKIEERERRQYEQKKRSENLIVEKVVEKTAALPMPNNIVTKDDAMPKAAKPSTPLAPLQALFDATCSVYEQQPASVRRLFVIAGLRALIGETEKLIAAMETEEKAS